MRMRIPYLVSVAWLLLLVPLAIAKLRGQAIPGCEQDTCGSVSIDYPFGIGKNSKDTDQNCYLNEMFQVSCDEITKIPTLVHESDNFTLLEIRFPYQVILESKTTMAVDCQGSYNRSVFIGLKNFNISAQSNRFRAMGCDTTATIANMDQAFVSQCQTQWVLNGGKRHGGLSQCDTAVSDGSTGFSYNISDRFNYLKHACGMNCSFAVLAEASFGINRTVLEGYVNETARISAISIPLVAEWAIKDGNCSKESNKSTSCGKGAWCNYTASGSGYHCYCDQGCDDNPYLPDGCHSCRDSKFPTLPVALAGGFALAVTMGAASYSYGSWAQKKAFMKAASTILEHLNSEPGDISPPDSLDVGDANEYYPDPEEPPADGDGNMQDPKTADNTTTQDFKKEDLTRAIKLYRKGSRIAMWASRRICRANLTQNGVEGPVEIRKYTVQDKNQLKPFMLGVRTLSRKFNHPNVVQLLGISIQRSSLIYRHFSHTSLYDRLHKRSSQETRLSWDERLKIAVGTARGLAIMHAKGIYHRNLKSSNILINEQCNCKVVEFGVARLWQRSTLLNASQGYVDPQYVNLTINQLTARSDVYSFGVVLVELITGKYPSSKVFNQKGSSLAMSFVSGRLDEMVDHNIWADERRGQFEAVAKIANHCLQLKEVERWAMLTVRDNLSKLVPGQERRRANTNSNGRGQNVDFSGRIEAVKNKAQKYQEAFTQATEEEGVELEP